MKFSVGPVDSEGNHSLAVQDEDGMKVLSLSGPMRTRQGDENSLPTILVLVAIHQQLERIADAMEASVTAPPAKTTRSKTDG